MKGISVMVGAAIIIVITVGAIILALNLGRPAVDRTKEILIMQEGKNILLDIDNAVKSVASEGNRSTRLLEFNILDGSLKIDGQKDAITFSMDSRAQIVGIGVSKIEDGINVTGTTGMIYLNLSYDNIDVVGSFEFGKGNRRLTIRNEGYNPLIQKQTVSFS